MCMYVCLCTWIPCLRKSGVSDALELARVTAGWETPNIPRMLLVTGHLSSLKKGYLRTREQRTLMLSSLSPLKKISLHLLTYMGLWDMNISQHVYGGQFSPLPMWVSGTKLRFSGLAVSTFSSWALLLALSILYNARPQSKEWCHPQWMGLSMSD